MNKLCDLKLLGYLGISFPFLIGTRSESAFINQVAKICKIKKNVSDQLVSLTLLDMYWTEMYCDIIDLHTKI